MKRLMCAAMAGITALTSIVMTVPAAAEEKTNRYGDFEYKINGSEVAITKYVGDDSSVYIPDYIDGRKVTEIREGAFALLDEHNEAIENEKLTHVRLPAYLESIGREAFYHTTSLESIVLPASLKEVGYFAFEGSGISELVIGSDLKLADNSFAECVNLSTVSLYPNTTWYTNYYTGTPFRSTTGMSDVYYLGNGKESDFVGYFAVGYPSTIGDANFYAFNEFEYYGVSVQKFDPHDTHALVTFNTNGGDTANTQIYALKGQMVSEAIPPEKKDCEFVGWYDNKACTGEPWDFTTDRVSSDMTLYAKFIPAQYTITFDPQGGTCDTKSGEYSFGQGVGNLPTPTKTNYTFLGWYSRPECGGTKYTATTPMPRTNITLYAGWLQNGKSLVVNYNANGGKCDKEKSLVPFNGTITDLPTPKMEGYRFLGWFDESGKQYTSSTKVTDDNLALTAKWEVQGLSITFDANGGSCDKTEMKVTYGKKAGKLPEPTRDGYSFLGWYYTKNSQEYELTSDITITSSISAYAKWDAFEYMILLDARSGKCDEESVFAYCGEKIGDIPTPTRKGYYFGGWYTKPGGKGTLYTDKSLMPSKDFTLYAKWTKISGYASKVTLNSTKATLGVGQKLTLKPVTTPQYTLDKFTWTSSNPKVCSVNANGQITALKKGTATITVKTTKGKTATCKVTVKSPATSIKLNYTKRTVSAGQEIIVKATVKGYGGKLTWSCNNSCAKVDDNGNITALKKGTAIITVKTYNGKTASLTLTIK